MKVASAWSGHDCSFCILEDGRPVVHAEYERYIREKEPAGDGVQFLFDEYKDSGDIKYFATNHLIDKLRNHDESYQRMKKVIEDNGGQMFVLGHHQCHAANAFFSSNFDESLIITMDGGGVESADQYTTSFTVWAGKDNKIEPIEVFPFNQVNVGGIWTRVTRYVFEMQSGWPYGHQAGTLMAMAALGNPDKYFDDFYRMLTTDLVPASTRAPGQPRGAVVPGKDPKHPYLHKWKAIAEKSEEDKFDLAAGLQKATEVYMQRLLDFILESHDHTNICFAGGVSLNSVVMGKMFDWLPGKNLYVTPTPHDGGLTLGAAQYVWHHILDNPRIKWEDNFSPYLGFTYDNLSAEKKKYKDKVKFKKVKDSDVINLLDEQNIVAVFGGGSESGRRALGNRSILADPRSPEMKDIINEKVKHRQWFRPFAPSILREEVKNWFTKDHPSPYMSFVLKFKEEVREKVPAVVHFDGSARLQTVTENDNKWYYNFIKEWHNKTNVPILLNTSFNDREPICETPEHAINCFLKTEIDYLYFYDKNLLVERK